MDDGEEKKRRTRNGRMRVKTLSRSSSSTGPTIGCYLRTHVRNWTDDSMREHSGELHLRAATAPAVKGQANNGMRSMRCLRLGQ